MNHQQYIMKSVNNLALLLVEAMQEMNSQMMQMKSSGSVRGNAKVKAQVREKSRVLRH
jgi:hypothetical protein